MTGKEHDFGSEGDSISPGLRNFGDKIMGRFQEWIVKDSLPDRSIASDCFVLGLIGSTWEIIRDKAEALSIEDAVERIKGIGGFEIDTDDLIMFEGGWIDPADYKEGLIEAVGKAYGWQELADAQLKFFDLARNIKKQSPES